MPPCYSQRTDASVARPLPQDAVLRDTIEWADEQKGRGNGDSLVLLLGDHGQTVTGDHGGATPEEVESVLFAYSTTALLPLSPRDAHTAAGGVAATRDFFLGEYFGGEKRGWKERVPGAVPRVWQTDLVPMMSLWLALPIPFGNLGAVVPSLVPSTGLAAQDDANLLAATRNNAQQVVHFLATYQKATGGSLPSDFVHRTQKLHASILAGGAEAGGLQPDAAALTGELRKVLDEAASGARLAWASFNEVSSCLTPWLGTALAQLYTTPFGSPWLSRAILCVNSLSFSLIQRAQCTPAAASPQVR